MLSPSLSRNKGTVRSEESPTTAIVTLPMRGNCKQELDSSVVENRPAAPECTFPFGQSVPNVFLLWTTFWKEISLATSFTFSASIPQLEPWHALHLHIGFDSLCRYKLFELRDKIKCISDAQNKCLKIFFTSFSLKECCRRT